MKAKALATMSIEQTSRAYGRPQPRVEIQMRRDATFHELRAVLHLIAAEIAMTTPPEERWRIRLAECSDQRGQISIELSEGNEDEAKRAMEVLRRVVG
ncbi:MAG: hypothetical protein ACHREM_11075 [Polyangiales bacterium]